MIIAKSINQYNNNYVYFCNPIKNNIIYDGKFIRIIYSTPQLIMNGIFLHLELFNVSCEKNFNKYKYSFNIEKNNSIIEEIKNIEQQLLMKADIKIKIPQFKLYEQLISGNIKLLYENMNSNKLEMVIKISGIWETQFNYGLTFKFIQINKNIMLN
jgi:hypothetical protein